jgi:hypothetical protein
MFKGAFGALQAIFARLFWLQPKHRPDQTPASAGVSPARSCLELAGETPALPATRFV